MNFLLCFFFLMQRKCRVFCFVLLIALVGCTETKVEAPIVLDLRALPNSITIGDTYFYPKPFSIRAKYSDNTEKNISARMMWLSENTTLITINQQGEIEKVGECDQIKCGVSVIATDPESGRSLRLTINISQKKTSHTTENSQIESAPESVSPEREARVKESVSLVADEPIENGENKDNSAAFVSPFFLSNSSLGLNDTPSNQNVITEGRVNIEQILFESQNITLTSGEMIDAHILGENFEGDKRLLSSGYECFVRDVFNATVMLVAPCQLTAAKPGEVEIGLRSTQGQFELNDTQTLTVNVLPRQLFAEENGVNQPLVIANYNVQQWFEIKGLRALDYYRVFITADLSHGHRVSIFPHSPQDAQTCMNTASIGSLSIACYFQAFDDSVFIAFDNPALKSLQGHLSVTPADSRLFQNTEKQNPQVPVNLELNQPVSDFIMANEVGTNNQHYYSFQSRDSSGADLRVTLSGYTADIQLLVTGSARGCQDESFSAVNQPSKACRIGNDNGGKIRIQINGNFGDFGQSNGPAAAIGGTYYQLLVSEVNPI